MTPWYGTTGAMPPISIIVKMSIKRGLWAYDVKQGYWDGTAWRYLNGSEVVERVSHWRAI
jgi:hypothetical protein